MNFSRQFYLKLSIHSEDGLYTERNFTREFGRIQKKLFLQVNQQTMPAMLEGEKFPLNGLQLINK